MAYVVCFGFLNVEYRIALVDFICSSRGRIRKLRLAYIVCLVFLNEEYLIALVDFIAPCGGTKGRRRRTLRSPSPPWNHACVVHWTPPPHPWVSAAAGHDCCRGLMPILDSGIRCKSLLPSSEYGLAICVRFCIVRVSVGLPSLDRSFFIIGGGDRSYLRLRMVLLCFFVGSALTAIGSFLLVGNGM